MYSRVDRLIYNLRSHHLLQYTQNTSKQQTVEVDEGR